MASARWGNRSRRNPEFDPSRGMSIGDQMGLSKQREYFANRLGAFGYEFGAGGVIGERFGVMGNDNVNLNR